MKERKFEDLTPEEQKQVMAEIEARENTLDGDGILFEVKNEGKG